MKEIINNIYKEASERKWHFTRLFSTLKKAGLKKYTVELDRLKTTYFWKDGLWAKDAEGDFRIKGEFTVKAIQDAIAVHNEKKTSYIDFVKDITKKGCTHYVVDFDQKTVTYFGKNSSDKYVEKVPYSK